MSPGKAAIVMERQASAGSPRGCPQRDGRLLVLAEGHSNSPGWGEGFHPFVVAVREGAGGGRLILANDPEAGGAALSETAA